MPYSLHVIHFKNTLADCIFLEFFYWLALMRFKAVSEYYQIKFITKFGVTVFSATNKHAYQIPRAG